MFCAKIGSQCPHPVFPDPNFVFVLMPFKNSESIFDSIKRSVEEMRDKNFICERADKKYTSRDIWCKKICRSILKAKYLIVDATGLNPNVFYELGFAHALAHTKNIIITRGKISELPFDIRGFSVIGYTYENLPNLRKELQQALMDLEEESSHEIERTQSTEEMINELKGNLRNEEKRADKYKLEVRESEKREDILKNRIAELEAIVANPEKEAQKLLAEKEGEISRLRKELSFLDQKKKQKIKELKEKLEEEKNQYHTLQDGLKKFKQTGDEKKLSYKASQTKIENWKSELFEKGKEYRLRHQPEEAFAIFTKLIEAAPDYQKAYYQRAFCLRDMRLFDGAIADLNQAINLNPEDMKAYSNRGLVYSRLGNFDRALTDLNKALSLSKDNIAISLNKAEILVIAGKPSEAEKTIREKLKEIELIEHKAVSYYLLAISQRLQNKKTEKTDAKLDSLLQSDFLTEWTFIEIELWLKKAKIEKEIKDYIRKKIKLLKKHRKLLK